MKSLFSDLEMLYSTKILNWQMNGDFIKAQRCLDFAKDIEKVKNYDLENFIFDIHEADDDEIINWIKGYAQINGYSHKNLTRKVTSVYYKTTFYKPAIEFFK